MAEIEVIVNDCVGGIWTGDDGKGEFRAGDRATVDEDAKRVQFALECGFIRKADTKPRKGRR